MNSGLTQDHRGQEGFKGDGDSSGSENRLLVSGAVARGAARLACRIPLAGAGGEAGWRAGLGLGGHSAPRACKLVGG